MSRKRYWGLLIVAATLALGRSASAEPLRLEQAVELALRNNERAKKAPLRVAAADAQVERARDAFLPTLTASGSSTLRPDTRGNNPSTAGAVTLTQPLLNPSSFPQYSQASHNRESEKWGAAQDVRQLQFDTARAFIQTLTAEGVLRSAERKLASAELNLDTAKARAEAGLTSSNDVTKAELQLATSRAQVANARGNVQRTYIALSFLVGEKVEGPLVPPDNTTRAAQLYDLFTACPARLVYPGLNVFDSVPSTLGLLALTLGRRDVAHAHFDDAEELEASIPAPNLLARTRARRGGRLRLDS